MKDRVLRIPLGASFTEYVPPRREQPPFLCGKTGGTDTDGAKKPPARNVHRSAMMRLPQSSTSSLLPE